MANLKCSILVLRIIVCILYEVNYLTVNAQEVQGSCSEIFHIKSIKDGIWYGSFTVVPSNTNNLELSVEFYAEELLADKDDLGELELYTNGIKKVENLLPVQFKLTFPKWLKTTPFISRMQANGNTICNSSIPFGVSLDTSITLKKKLQIKEISNYPSMLPTAVNEVCGKLNPATSKYTSAINIEDYPWLAAIYIKRGHNFTFSCAGTLISRKHILTAAHCTAGLSPGIFLIVLGMNDTEGSFSSGLIRKVNRIEYHDDFLANYVAADLSIMFLDEEVIFSDTVQSACIWRSETNIDSIIDRQGAVVRWYNNDYGPSGSLRRGFIPVVSTQICRESNPLFVHYTSENTFCAGKLREKQPSRPYSPYSSYGYLSNRYRSYRQIEIPRPCNAESGSGFFLEWNNTMIIRGVLSLTYRNGSFCDFDNYAIFTDVAKYYDWIQKSIRISPYSY